MKKLFFIILVLFTCSFAKGQEFRKYTNNFLHHGIDARGRALGNAVATSSEDVFASYWNPAGLANTNEKQTQIGYMHVFDGLYNYDVAGIVVPTKKTGQALALNIVRYGIDDIPNTIFLVDESGNINPNNITTFNAADYGGFLSYSKSLSSNISLGASAKIIHRNVGDFAKAWGTGIDFGIKYNHLNEKLKIAAVAKDVFGTYTSWNFNFNDAEIRQVFLNTGNDLPKDGSIEATSPNLVLGGSYLFSFGNVTLLPELNLDVTFDGQRNTFINSNTLNIDPHFGVELGYTNKLFLRAGINNVQELTNTATFAKEWTAQPSAGAGIKQKRFEMDYALTQFDLRDELSHLITVKFGITKSDN